MQYIYIYHCIQYVIDVTICTPNNTLLVNWVVNNILDGEVGNPFNMYEETSVVGNAGLVM